MKSNPSVLYSQKRRGHWDKIALNKPESIGGRYYHKRLRTLYRNLVAENHSVLEIGCGQGDLLASLKPSLGVGCDLSGEMLQRARDKHPELAFVQADGHKLPIKGKFDFIVLSDLINDAWDVQALFTQLRPLCTPQTRIIVNYFSRLWQLPLDLGRLLNLSRPTLTQNWLARDDVNNLFELVGMEIVRGFSDIVFPLQIPLLTPLLNRYLGKFWPFIYFSLTNFTVARFPAPEQEQPEPTVSVIVPARNEAGNIAAVFERTPRMGANTELVFVEGHSRDDTWQVIEQEIAKHPDWDAVAFRQTGEGKGDAVRLGFEKASGDVLMILDADLTVPPEDLPRFYSALVDDLGEFVNGVRLVYPMEEKAMRYLNLMGNKFFSMAFSWLLGQPIKDTLCGTKVLYKRDYLRIAENRSYFGDFDPFGDFDLLFGAARQSLEIVEVPIRYRQRVYGDTNIDRWRHGLLLLRMTLIAARRLKFL